MATMTKMRDNAHIFIIAFIVIFVAFWVVSDADIGTLLQGSQNEIGNIDGREITYQEFNALVQQVAEQRRAENEGQELDENSLASIREQVWNEFITQAVIDRAVVEYGITASDQEINDWVRSPNPPEQITQYFKDSTGALNREAYEQFLINPGPENQQALLAIEGQLRSELIRSKLTALLASTMFVTDDKLMDAYNERSLKMAANFVLFNPGVIASKDTSAPTDEEFAEYYERNKEQYKIEDSRKMKYVIFPDVAAASDSTAVLEDLQKISEKALGGADFLKLIDTYSTKPYEDAWVSLQELPAEVVSTIAGKSIGDIVGPVASDAGVALYKIMDQRDGTETLVKASHILLRVDGGQNEDAQRAKAADILREAKSSSDFAALAGRYSEEPGAVQSGGSLPWFGKGRMVKEFEEAAMAASVGSIIGPVKTQFGFHIIKIEDKTSKEVKLASIIMQIDASGRTRDLNFERAEDFAFLAGETSFDQEAQEEGLQIQETPEFSEQSGSFIPGIGLSVPLMKFAFEGAVGDISEVQRASSGYVVAVLTDNIPAGYRELSSEMKLQIAPQIVFERQMNKTLEMAKSMSSGKSIEQIAASSPALRLDSTGLFTIAQGPGSVGRDDAFIGKLMGLEIGEMTKPFKGQRGVYVAKLLMKTPFDEAAFKVGRDELRRQTLQQSQNEFIQSWLEQKKEDLEIVDNRYRFFR
jgi:peptidyl-prolyl cis-trans isomerase D